MSWLSWTIITLVTIFAILAWLGGPRGPLDPNLVEPCPKCGSRMQHLPGQDAGSTGEALFGCKNEKCGHRQHRGGWCSELQYEKTSVRRKK